MPENAKDSIQTWSNRTRFARRLSSVSLIAAVAAFFFNWVAAFYRGLPVSEMLSDYADDGLCPTPDASIGVHCFGDFYVPMEVLLGERGPNPWLLDGSWNYSPIANWPLLPLAVLSRWFDWRSLLVLFVVATVALSVWAAVSLARVAPGQESGALSVWSALVVVGSTPFIAAFDRGNTVIVAVPLFLFAMYGPLHGRWRRWRWAVLFLAALKPQFVALFFVEAVTGRWKLAFRWTVAAIIVQLSSFMVLGREAVSSAWAWMTQGLGGYSFVSSGQFGDRNVSVIQFIIDVTTVIDSIIFSGRAVLSAAPVARPTLVSVLVVVMAGIALFGFDRRERLALAVTLAAVFSFTGPILSFHYYLVYAPILLLLLISGGIRIGKGETDEVVGTGVVMRPLLATPLAAFCVVASFQFAIPMSAISDQSSEWGLVSRFVAGVALVTFLSLVVAVGIRQLLPLRVSPRRSGST